MGQNNFKRGDRVQSNKTREEQNIFKGMVGTVIFGNTYPAVAWDNISENDDIAQYNTTELPEDLDLYLDGDC